MDFTDTVTWGDPSILMKGLCLPVEKPGFTLALVPWSA